MRACSYAQRFLANLTRPSSCEGFCSTCDRQASSDLFGQHVVSQSSNIKPYSCPAGTGHVAGKVTRVFVALCTHRAVRQKDCLSLRKYSNFKALLSEILTSYMTL